MTAEAAWSAPDRNGGRIMESPEGQWRLRIGSGEVRVVFHPNLPGTRGPRHGTPEDKARWMEEWAAYANHPGKAAFTEAYQKAGHFFGHGNDEAMLAETVEEAIMLVDAMIEGDAVLLSAEEQLRNAGFEIKHPGQDCLQGLWSRRIRSGSLDVSLKNGREERSAWITYHGDGAQSWHNIAHVSEHWEGQGGIIHHSFPEQVRDPLRVAVAHSLRVMEKRLARGGRFSKPLGEISRRVTGR